MKIKLGTPKLVYGVGLPPIGTVCEYYSEGGEWRKCEIVAYYFANVVAVDVFDSSAVLLHEGLFRPIKTPDQIAAEDRKLDIKERCEVASKRPQEWDGVGLPPVGSVCEYSITKDEWLSGEVFGHRVCSNGDVEVFVNLKNNWDYSSALGRFRPIKTPEQIAAEERLHAIDEMVDLAQRSGSIFKDVMKALYDAGYRKTEV